MPLGLYLDTPQGRKPATLATHFTLNDFRKLIEKKVGNPEHYDYFLGDIFFRTWDEEAFNRQRSAIHDGISLIVEYPLVITDAKSQTGPTWRQASAGLCVEGVCLNIKCQAFERKVLINHGLGRFSLIQNSTITQSSCPVCSLSVQPLNCAFYRCSWRVLGTKVDSSSSVTTEWEDAKEDYHRWKESLTSWKDLTIETQV